MPKTRPPWVMLAILVAAAVLSFVDRQILSLLVEPIKRDLGIDDFAMGLLAGPAFAIFYALAGVPLGWLADRVDRGRLMAAGVAAWSVMTALSGFAGSYTHLFIARIGVGVGEATLGPAAHSIIADRFDKARLPLAMSIYGTGVALGAGLAFALGGQVVALATGPARVLPLVGSLAPWQLTFVLVGLPGLAVALLLLLTVRDPRARRPAASVAPAGLCEFWRGRRALILLYVSGVSLLGAAGFANLLWLPSVFVRNFGWTAPQIGTVIGLLLITLGIGGVLLCGLLATALIRRGRSDGALIVTAGAAIASLPFALSTLMPDATTTLLLVAPGILVSSAYVGLGPAIVQAATPPELRGRIAALALMITGLLSMVVGPVGVGAVTTYGFGDPAKVGVSLALMSVLFYAGGAACLLAARGPYRRAIVSSPTPAATVSQSIQ